MEDVKGNNSELMVREFSRLWQTVLYRELEKSCELLLTSVFTTLYFVMKDHFSSSLS
jgi:hypothetical protein